MEWFSNMDAHWNNPKSSINYRFIQLPPSTLINWSGWSFWLSRPLYTLQQVSRIFPYLELGFLSCSWTNNFFFSSYLFYFCHYLRSHTSHFFFSFFPPTFFFFCSTLFYSSFNLPRDINGIQSNNNVRCLNLTLLPSKMKEDIVHPTELKDLGSNPVCMKAPCKGEASQAVEQCCSFILSLPPSHPLFGWRKNLTQSSGIVKKLV